jgi:DNA polymerase-3 subunit delta'
MLFNSVVGHSKQLATLRELVESGRFPNGALFCGPEGVGKRLVGRLLLEEITGSPLNVLEFGVEKPVTVEEVRELSRWLFLKPQSGKGKGVIIDNAELMRSESANALLKTLEEPPEYGYLILIARNEEGVLPTIRSRCRTFRFGRLSDANVEFVLERLGIEYDKRVVKIARGSPGLALRIAQSQVVELLTELINLLKSPSKLKEITQFSARFTNLSREESLLFLDALEALLSQRDTILKWAEGIQQARRFLNYYGKPRSVIEWLLIKQLTSS